MSFTAKIRIIGFAGCLFIIAQYGKGNMSDPDSPYEERSRMSYGVEMDFNDKYIWHGIIYNNGFVIQPNIWISYCDFTFGVWGNAAVYDIHHSIKRHEVDINIEYKYALWNLNVKHSFMYYQYPHQSDSPPTGEFYIGLGYPAGEIQFVSSITFDVIKYSGVYFVEHGIEYEKPFTDKLYLLSSLSIGWASGKFNETYIGISEPTISLISFNVILTYYPAEYLYFKPHLQFNKILDENLYESLNRCSNYLGIAVGMEF